MKRPSNKYRERQLSADMSNKQNKNFEDTLLAKGDRSDNKLKERQPSKNSIEASTLINFDNIKISMINNNEDEICIERDSLEIINKNTFQNTNINNFTKDVFYGSPAIWLKNIKRKNKNESNIYIKKARTNQSNLFSSRNKTLNFNQENNNQFQMPLINVNMNATTPTMIKIHNEESERKIPLYRNDSSSIKLEKIRRTRNYQENSFNLNTSNNNISNAHNTSIFKTLINNNFNKFHNKNQEKKFSNLNHGSSKTINNTDNKIEKTEIDEIINTEVSEVFLKNINTNDKNLKVIPSHGALNKPSLILKNKILKIKSPKKNYKLEHLEAKENLGETIFINSLDNSENNSKNNSNNNNSIEKASPQISKNSSSDKNNLCNIGSKTNSDSLANNSNINSNSNSNKITSSEVSKGISSGSSGSNVNVNMNKNAQMNKASENIQNNTNKIISDKNNADKINPNPNNNNMNNLNIINNNKLYEQSESCSTSMFKTLHDKIQLDPYLHKSFTGKIKWKAGEIIAEGSSSIVYKALNEDEGSIFVVKRFKKINDPKLIETFQNEVKIFQQLDHPNIIKFIDSEIIDNDIFIYLEYMSGGSIKYILDKYGPLNENLTKIFLKQILEGLEYLHSKKIVHRDIKCANILLDVKGNIKLSDFGSSGQLKDMNSSVIKNDNSSDEFLDSLKGTLPWMAPEVILQNKYGKKADIWSLGCTLLEIATGNAPWGKLENCCQAMFKIGKSNDIPEIPSRLSTDFKDLLVKCFKRNPKERPSVKELKEHHFLK